jgi:hypothetical protein
MTDAAGHALGQDVVYGSVVPRGVTTLEGLYGGALLPFEGGFAGASPLSVSVGYMYNDDSGGGGRKSLPNASQGPQSREDEGL